MNPTTTKPPLSLWRVLWLGTAVILVFEAIAILAGAYLGVLGTFFILLFGGFFIGGAASKYIKSWAGAAGVTGFLIGMMIVGMNAAKPILLSFTEGKSSLGYAVSVNDAPEYNVTFFEFKNGQIKAGLTGYSFSDGYVANRTGSRGYNARTEYFVAPLVKEDWTTNDEIPVWVVCTDTWNTDEDFSDTDTCRREWAKDHRVGVEIEAGQKTDVIEAVKNAEAEHKLHSHPTAKYIIWSKDAEFVAGAAKGSAIGLMIFTHLAFVIGVLVKRKSIY